MGRRALWAICLLIGAVLILVAGVWIGAGYQIADRLLGLYQSASGWRRAYLFVGALAGSYTVVRLIPLGARRLRRAAEGHDRVSAVMEMATWVPFLSMGGLALGLISGMLWPVSVPLLVREQRRAAARRSAEDREASRALRSEILREVGRGAP